MIQYLNIHSKKNILGIVKRNSLFFHLILCKNNGFLFITPNINLEQKIK